jgi:hypothetical protein
MTKWIACGSFTDPKRSKEYMRFSSKQEWEREEQAENEAQLWREEKRYTFVWIEKVGK